MNRYLSFLGMLLLGGAVHAQSPSAKPEPPAPPYIASVPAPASWSIRSINPPVANPEAPTIKEIRVAKARDKKQELTIWSNGAESESWFVDTFVIYRQPHFVKGDVAILEQRPDSSDHFFSTSDFSNLAWVGKDTFQRTETVKGKLCYYYENGRHAEQERIPEPLRDQIKLAISKAWIDARTKLPVAVEEGGIRQEYDFTFGSPASLTLPPLFAARLEKLLNRRKAATAATPSSS